MKHFAVFIFLFLLLSGRLSAQVEESFRQQQFLPGSFLAELLCFADRDTGTTRIDMFVQVGYDALTFVKTDSGFSASYDLTIAVVDSADSVVMEKNWTESILCASFDASVAAGAANVSQRSGAVPPGKYTVSIQLHDTQSDRTATIRKIVTVPILNGPGLSMSNIMLLSRYQEMGGRKTIVPSISSNMGTVQNGFYVFLEAYNHSGYDSLHVETAVRSRNPPVESTHDTVLNLQTGRNDVFLRIDNTRLPVGDYALKVSMAGMRDTNDVLAEVTRSFMIRWSGMPLSVNSLDAAIEQFAYIAKHSELDSLREAPTVEEKQRLFLEFWRRRDPNPNTPKNERMEEYYSRVDYANRHFTHVREGWKTDMGMVYIVLGPPSNVDRHPMEMGSKPYEIWSYYDRNQAFVFVDDLGFGDYRLITPYSEVFRKSE